MVVVVWYAALSWRAVLQCCYFVLCSCGTLVVLLVLVAAVVVIMLVAADVVVAEVVVLVA